MANTVDSEQGRDFTLKYRVGTFFQQDEDLSDASITYKAASVKDALLKAMAANINLEDADMKRVLPSSMRLNVSEDQSDESNAEWVTVVERAPRNWQQLLARQGYKMELFRGRPSFPGLPGY